MTALGDRIAAAKRHPADLTYSEWVELLEDVEKALHCDDERPVEADRVRVGQGMKWAPMLGYQVIDHESGVVLILMSDGSVRWADGSVPGEPS